MHGTCCSRVHRISNGCSVLCNGNVCFEYKEEYVNQKMLCNILPLFRLYFVNICTIFHIQAETGIIWLLINTGAWFQASSPVTSESSLFWDITQRNLVVTDVSGQRIGPIFQWSLTVWPLKMGTISCPETLVTNYQCALRNIPEERRSHDASVFEICFT